MNWFWLFFIMIFSGCISSKRDYVEIVSEITGKTLSYPDSIVILNGPLPDFQATDFTILSYFNSSECTSCNMKLSLWSKLLENLDTIRDGVTVSLVLVVSTDAVRELTNALRRDGFKYPVIVDVKNRFLTDNTLPKDSLLQSFLLGSKGEILVIGNPIENPTVRQLYISQIVGDFINDNEEAIYSYDFSMISPGQKMSHVFSLINSSKDSLKIERLIPSCECVYGKVSKRNVAPNEMVEVEVTLSDTVHGEFLRSILVTFENYPDIKFEVTGFIR